MGFPTGRPATELGNEVASHKTSFNVSPEFHQLISYARFEIIKAVLASQGFWEKILSNPDWRDRTKWRNVLILRDKIKVIFLRHCWEICSDAEL